MKKGLNLWTLFGWKYSGVPKLEEAIKLAAEIGYDGVEFVYDDDLLDPDKLDKRTRRSLIETAESAGIIFSSVATGVFWKYNLASPDERLRRRGLKYLRKGIELAHDLEAPVLLVVPGVAQPEVPYEKAYELAKESLLKAARIAEDYDVVIGVENVWNKLFYSPLEFRRFLDDIGHDYVKAYFDVANVLNFGYPEHWISLLKGRIACVHAKDFDVNIGNITAFRIIGKGSLGIEGWKRIVALLKEAGYDYFLVVEAPPDFYPEIKQPKYPEDGIRAAKDNLEALKRILG